LDEEKEKPDLDKLQVRFLVLISSRIPFFRSPLSLLGGFPYPLTLFPLSFVSEGSLSFFFYPKDRIKRGLKRRLREGLWRGWRED
jgi:hypothetical protein